MKQIFMLSLAIWMSFFLAISAQALGNKAKEKDVEPPMTKQNELIRTSPESQGISSAAILAFIEDAEENIDALHSVMLLRHGQVVAEGWWAPYASEHPHRLYSLSKIFTSTAIGMAIDEGLLGIDDPILKFFPDEGPEEPSDNLKALRVRQLLSMSTGHTEGTMISFWEGEHDTWAAAFLAEPVTHKPGTFFMYNTGATYMLSAIITKVSGMSLMEYLQPRLFGPLDIVGATWQTDPQGINTGGYGLSVKTEDIARLGQMYLQKGMWRGQRLLTEAWVEEATSRQVSNGSDPESDWSQGYGYKFWLCRHGLYRGDGAFGQYCIVMPEQDAVLAITSGVQDMQQVMNVAWDHLLPAMQEKPLPKDTEAQKRLEEKLENLAFEPQPGKETSPLAAKISGVKYTFALEEKEREVEGMSFEFGENESIVTFTDSRGEQKITCGSGEWVKGKTMFDNSEERLVAASGAWITEDTYVVKLCFYETPFMPTITCKFTDEGLLYDFEANVSWGDPKRPQLVGQAE